MWLKVKFSSKNCLTYEGDITLKNIDNPNDVRIYKLYIDVRPKDIKATLPSSLPNMRLNIKSVVGFNNENSSIIFYSFLILPILILPFLYKMQKELKKPIKF